MVESSLLSHPKKRELAKVARDVFSRLFSNCPINESAEDLGDDITKEPPMRKSKAEELNDILFQPEDQHLDCGQENILTHIKKKKDTLRSNKGVFQSLEELEILSKLTSTLFYKSREVFQCC